MTDLTDPAVKSLLDGPNHAVLSSQNGDGSILSTVVWTDFVGGELAVNSAVGRRWPTNLQRDPHLTLVVFDSANPYEFVEIRGTATGTLEGADAHIDRLAKKYIGQDRYPFRQPGEERIKFVIDPHRVRYIKQ